MSSASEDRFVHPGAVEDPRSRDREVDDPAQRQVTHPQDPEGAMGTSSDAPGFDPADRDRADEAAGPAEEGPESF